MSNKKITKGATSKVGNYQIISKFPGYNARQDKTTLDPSTLIFPSQNVVIKTSGRIASVPGYVLDGVGSTVIDSGILSNYDFANFKNDVRNMRAGFLTSAGNDGKLQYRYVTGPTVNWVTLASSLTNVRLSYTSYWDTAELKKLLLWVDGSNNIFEWNGAVTTFASATATTITKQGTLTWDQEGFYQTRNKQVVIGGTTYTYTGGDNSTTLTGVTPDPTLGTYAVGAIVPQAPVTTPLSSMTAILTTLGPTLIGCGRRNQVYVGSSSSNNQYISKTNNFLDYSFTTPVRIVGEGALIPLDSPPVSYIAQEVTANEGGTNAYDMWISEGTDTWAIIRATLSSDLTKETLEHIRLKVAPLQGAKSGRLVGKMKNHIMSIGNDGVASFIGYISYQYIPAMVDFSYPIIDDMNSYDFTDGSVFYHRNYIYVAIPKSGIIRVYNMTDQTQEQFSSYKAIEDVPQMPWFWESPITYPLSGFYVVNGEIYGHSYTTSESYKLFTGGSLNGQDITTNATFGYDDKGDRSQSKASDEIYVEGYIKQNTKLNATVSGDLDAFMTSQTVVIDGANNKTVAFGAGSGKTPLGTKPLGGALTPLGGTQSPIALPAWFHVVKTYPNVPSYLEQLSFATKGVDLQWELICFGTNATMTVEGNNDITD